MSSPARGCHGQEEGRQPSEEALRHFGLRGGRTMKEERTEARAVDRAGARANCQVVGAAKSRENGEFILALSN